MERLNGFFRLRQGKRGFTGNSRIRLPIKKVHVFIDNFSNQKIRLVYKDSAQLFINLKDSVETQELFLFFQEKIAGQDSME